MSQDLLAAFGAEPSTTAKPGPAAQNANNAPSSFSFFNDFNANTNTNPSSGGFGNTTTPAAAVAARPNTTQSFAPVTSAAGFRDDAGAPEISSSSNNNNEDDWGDFEGTADEPKAPLPIASQFSRWLDEEDDGFPDYDERNAAPKRTGKWDFTKPDPPVPQPSSSSSLSRVVAASKPTPAPTPAVKFVPVVKSAPKPQEPARDPNVLFDAENEPPDEDDDDDFGDFEGADESAGVSAEMSSFGIESVPSSGFTSAPYSGFANVPPSGFTNVPPSSFTNVQSSSFTNAPSSSFTNAPSSGFADLLGMDSMESMAPPVAQNTFSTTTTTPAPAPSSSLLDLEDLTINDESTNVWGSNNSQPPIHGFGTLGPLSSKSPPPSFSPDKGLNLNPVEKQQKPKPTPKPLTSPRKQSPVKRIATPPKPVEDDEGWDDFEAWEQGADTAQPASSKTPSTSSLPQIPLTLTSDTADSSLSTPPTNIPPPALVLTLFPTLFQSAETSFFRPLRQESSEVQQAIYNEAAAITYLKGMLAIGTVCGRVIAGRKQRWKRDTILAQSMRIGPSAAGGVSGLKLTSIDKGENAKEEREAADALKAWQGQVGKLKSALAEVKRATGRDIGKIPELRDTMPVKVAKEIEGGLKGNRPCALCGLKREERVLKVDYEVEDSFGEWWVENVSMHRACRNFWEQHRDSLRYK